MRLHFAIVLALAAQPAVAAPCRGVHWGVCSQSLPGERSASVAVDFSVTVRPVEQLAMAATPEGYLEVASLRTGEGGWSRRVERFELQGSGTPTFYADAGRIEYRAPPTMLVRRIKEHPTQMLARRDR